MRSRQRGVGLSVAVCLMLCCVQPSAMVLAQASRPAGSLRVERVYQAPVHLPASWLEFLDSAHFVGRGRILLLSKAKLVFMCAAEDGSVVWQGKEADLVGKDNEYAQGILAAWYDNEGVLCLVWDSWSVYYVRYWEKSGRVERDELTGDPNMPWHIYLSPFVRELPRHGDLLLAPLLLCQYKRVDLYDLAKRRVISRLRPKLGKCDFGSAAFSPDGRYAAATAESVYVWDLTSGKRLNDVYEPADEVIRKWRRVRPPLRDRFLEVLSGNWSPWDPYSPEHCAFSHDAKLLAVGTSVGHLVVFDVASAKALAVETEKAPCRPVTHLGFLGETQYLLVAKRACPLQVYDVSARKWVEVPAFKDNPHIAMAVTTHDHSIFVCDLLGNLWRFDWAISETPRGVGE